MLSCKSLKSLLSCMSFKPLYTKTELIFDNTKSLIYKGMYESKVVAIKYCYYNAEDEIKNLVALKDTDGVINISHAVQQGRRYVIIMDYCYGGDLFNWVINNRNPSSDTIKVILQQIIRATIECHKAGFIHSDLKLDNIGLLRENDINSVVLLDMGSSIRVDTYRPGTHAFVISPQYAAPELCRSDVISSHMLQQIDYWSIGVIAFTLAVGHYPAHKRIKECRCAPHFESVIGPIAWDTEVFEEGFNTLLHRLLERDANDRYTDTTIIHDKWLNL